MKYLSTTFDVLVITAIIFVYHDCGGYSTTLKSPTFMNYLLVVPLTALRFDPRLALYAGALVILSYGGLLASMLALEPVEFGSVSDIFTSPRVNALYEGFKITYLLALSILTFCSAQGAGSCSSRATRHSAACASRPTGGGPDPAASYVPTRWPRPCWPIEPVRARRPLGGGTILFADLDRFTTWSETSDPEESWAC